VTFLLRLLGRAIGVYMAISFALHYRLGPRLSGAVTTRDVAVAMPDGVELLTDIYQPDAPGPHPTLLMRLPYGRNGFANVALIYAQRSLSRLTHRTFNVPLAAATVVTAVLALGAGGVLVAQRVHLHGADADGSTPVASLAEARIFALRERGDEALTLVARGGSGPLEKDFTDVAKPGVERQLSGAADATDSDPAVQALAGKHDAYVAAHAAVRKLDDGGDYDGAVALSIGKPTTETFNGFTNAIGTALEQRKATFTDEIDAAGRGLGLLTVLGPVLALLICGLAAAGIRTRLEEYR